MKKQFSMSLRNIKSISRQTNDDVACYFVLRGSLWLDIQKSVYSLKKSDFVVVNSFQDYELVSIEDEINANLILCLSFYSDYVMEYLPSQQLPVFNNFLENGIRTEATPVLKEMMVRMAIVYFRNKGNERLNLYQYFLQFLSYLMKYLEREPAIDSKKALGRMDRVTNLIKERYMEQITLDSIANELEMSYAYCSRLFKKEMGISFIQYLNDVRLMNAAQELLQNQSSVLKIAFNNGFANVKTFHQLFKKKMGVTPKEYRTENKKNTGIRAMETKDHYKVLPQFDAIQALVNYLIEEDLEIKEVMVKQKLILPVDTTQNKPFSIAKRIIKMDYAEKGLQADVQQQLRTLQQEIGFDLVQFNGFCCESNAYSWVSPMSDYVYNNIWFDFLMEINLTPLIVLGIPNKKEDEELKYWCDEQIKILSYLSVRYGAIEVDKWYVQLHAGTWEEWEQKAYNYLHHEMKKMVPGIHIGVLGLTGINETEYYNFDHFMKQQNKLDRLPDFMEFHANPYTTLQMKDTYAKKFKYYQQLVLEKLKRIIKESVGQDYQPEIFLTEWDTMAGEENGLSGTLFHSGLIIEAIMEHSEQIHGLSFWLNAGEQNNNKFMESTLSLFLYKLLRQPVYFCLYFLKYLQGQIIEIREGYVLTKREETYHLLIYHSSYIDPVAAVDSFQIKNITKQLTIKLTNMKSGIYRVRHYILDKDHGDIFNEWSRAGNLEDLDQEMLKYLEDRIKPKIENMDCQVREGSAFLLNTFLTLDACQLYLIRKIR